MLWPVFVQMPTEDAVVLYVEGVVRDNAGLSGGITPVLVTSLESREYTVKKGDTMSAIASAAGVSIDALISLNNISNVRILQTGQKLLIPNIDGIVHSVASGENLAKIAESYKVKPTAILDANDLKSEKITVGQKLFIPGAQLSKIDRLKAMGELFVYPINGYISSYFGYRSDPISGVWSFHTGLDIVGPNGGAVWAAQDGIVRAAGWHAVYGNYVTINHGGGYETLYGHLSKISVYAGQYVRQYEMIGLEGSTGWSTGPHVHFTIYKYGSLVNPLLLLN
jgi:murein DD-endopeptidase MepM/ murein hydrolase activator NlpD